MRLLCDGDVVYELDIIRLFNRRRVIGHKAAVRVGQMKYVSLDSPELLDRLYDGVKFFDVRVHAVLAVIELLRKQEYLDCMGARNHDDSILISNDDIVRFHMGSIYFQRDVHSPKAIVGH